jgi:hypothetical protein
MVGAVTFLALSEVADFGGFNVSWYLAIIYLLA